MTLHRISALTLGATVLPCLGFITLTSQAEVPKALAENWYRTEVLIFVRENNDSRFAEQWEPLPTLEYPKEHRYLLDPATADRRLEESQSYASTIDGRGLQTLIVPAPIEEVLDHSRPDALITVAPELDLLLPGDDETDINIAERSGDPNNPVLDPNNPVMDPNSPVIDHDSPIIALPYELLGNDRLAFRTQARSLRRQGHRVVFHGSWWAMLDEADQTPAVIMDRSGDMDSSDWPALQGSLQIYRSRYLHIALDLWLNTQAEYLPDGWQIDAPPLPAASLAANTLAGRELNPWAPIESIDEAFIEPALAEGEIEILEEPEASLDSVSPQIAEEIKSAVEYPWRHAIVHRQSRRMRSGEIHYLDHPVIGVIVKISPMSDEELPLLAPQERAFRERHALPIELLPLDSESLTETP